jgi:hypothetical protein
VAHLIENSFGHLAPGSGVAVADFTRRQLDNEMQVVGHETVTEPHPFVLASPPRQRLNNSTGQYCVGEWRPLVTSTEREEILTVTEGVALHRKTMLPTVGLSGLIGIEEPDQLAVVFVCTHGDSGDLESVEVAPRFRFAQLFANVQVS